MMHSFDYEQALAFIHGTYGKGEKRGLANIHAMLSRLGNPHERLRCIHVAGTNGKGSTCAFIQAILRCAGFRVGLYTSPFLQRYNERMRVDGVPIADETLAGIAGRVADVVSALHAENIKPTEFEIGTAIAFLFFAEAEVDFAVIEVGLGGRNDPTNVITPLVSVIAAIGLDHVRVLGNTLEQIAMEKAGIVKRSVPVVVSGQNQQSVLDVIDAKCAEFETDMYIARPDGGMVLGLQGKHQEYNAATAVEAVRVLMRSGMAIPEQAIADGLRRAKWPGRLEYVGEEPSILLDGAHNAQGAQSLAEYVQKLNRRSVLLICGVMRDKDWRSIVEQFVPMADAVMTVPPDTHRALDASVLAGAFQQSGVPSTAYPSLSAALKAAQNNADQYDLIVVAGSLYLVGEARTLLLGKEDTLLSFA